MFIKELIKKLLDKYIPPRSARPVSSIEFSSLKDSNFICFYAGDIPRNYNYKKIGLSLNQSNDNHIKHDITNTHNINENSVSVYQAEDVFEHIEYNKLEFVIKDIYRILKPDGLFRLSVPDYRCDILYNRSIKDDKGIILFDPMGGGEFIKETKEIINGGHVWFPTYEKVRNLVEKAPFKQINFLHYYDERNQPHCSKIDYTKGYIQRTPDHDNRVSNPYRPMSIVVDCYK